MNRFLGKYVVGWLAVAWFALAGSFARAADTAPPSKRAEVPSADQQAEARKLLDTLFHKEFEQAKKPSEQVALANKLLQLGHETGKDRPGQYMLFVTARELAMAAGNAELALRAVDALGTYFDIDVLAAKLDLVREFAKTLPTETPSADKARLQLIGLLDPLVDKMVRAERYDLARQGATLVIELAPKSADDPATKLAATRLQEIELREKFFLAAQAARKTLETQPDDPAANGKLGQYLCFITGDWDQGLPRLAKGNEATLKKLAEQELAKPEDPDLHVALADGWWDLSENQQGPAARMQRARALFWYQLSYAKITGLAKVKVTSRIEHLGGRPGEVPRLASASPPLLSSKGASGPLPKLITNNIGMKLVLIPAGTFAMGSPKQEKERREDETLHRVKLTKPFYLGTTEVTQAQWTAVMQSQPWEGLTEVKKDAACAVSGVTWEEADEFCRKLSTKEEKNYRLPTEAEWEHACRANTRTRFYFGDSTLRINDYAWTLNQGGYARPGGQKRPNAWGLYDMCGNVWEWCSDTYSDYPTVEVTDPRSPDGTNARIARGGSWGSSPGDCRAARRVHIGPKERGPYYGLRVVYEP